LASSTALAQDAGTKSPNVVILLADDLGWADVGYHSDRVRTPHIDSLVRDGVELDRFYVCPMCSPTRAALLTGRYPIRFGMARAVIPPWRDFGLSPKEVTLAQVLGAASYKHRGVFGKWHLGHRQRQWHPLERGFTEFEGHYNGAIDYFELKRAKERDWHHDYEPSDAEGYATDLIADAAASFVRKRAKDGPFLCYVPFNAPHSPFQAPEKYIERYAGIEKKNARILRAMIECMDDGIGRILEAIDDAGVRENTIVWFFSDNGGIKGVRDNNLPLRGNKLTIFEGGIRVPAAVRWPAGLPKGKKVTQPISCVDILPTLLGLVDPKSTDVLSKLPTKPLDGRNVIDVLRTDAKREFEYFVYHGQEGPKSERAALIREPWKLIVRGPDISGGEWNTENHEVYLFRLDEDPNETTNLAESEKARVDKMARDLVAYRKLQPAESSPPYFQGRKGFQAVPKWKIPDGDTTRPKSSASRFERSIEDIERGSRAPRGTVGKLRVTPNTITADDLPLLEFISKICAQTDSEIHASRAGELRIQKSLPSPRPNPDSPFPFQPEMFAPRHFGEPIYTGSFGARFASHHVLESPTADVWVEPRLIGLRFDSWNAVATLSNGTRVPVKSGKNRVRHLSPGAQSLPLPFPVGPKGFAADKIELTARYSVPRSWKPRDVGESLSRLLGTEQKIGSGVARIREIRRQRDSDHWDAAIEIRGVELERSKRTRQSVLRFSRLPARPSNLSR